MSDALVSLIRTLVPVVVGLALSGLLKLGIEVDDAALSTVVDGVLVGAYYALIRALEGRYPWVGIFLGWKAQPSYTQQN